MKAMKWMLALVAMVLAVVSCSQKKEQAWCRYRGDCGCEPL